MGELASIQEETSVASNRQTDQQQRIDIGKNERERSIGPEGLRNLPDTRCQRSTCSHSENIDQSPEIALPTGNAMVAGAM